MHIFRLNIKKLSLWIIFVTQLLIITSYFYFQGDKSNNNQNIKFIENDTPNKKFNTYQSSNNNNKFISLKDVSTNTSFIDFNSSICYRNGTDLNLMKTKQSNWECHCLPGWHGSDCGQPEVLWRAFLTYRKPVKLKGPRVFQRRIIYTFDSDKFNEQIVDIRVNELQDVVDLFILFVSHNYNHKKLSYDLKNYLDKILFLPKENDWRKHVKNLHNDDIILTSDLNAIPSKNAILFMKFYDNWPQPIQFRMRHSVFGFFWFHPNKTKITGGAATVAFLRDNFDNRLRTLIGNNKKLFKGLILGDLNHYGGWYCEYCRESTATVEFLRFNQNSDVINWNAIATDKIDTTFIEELIENGLYLDSKTELQRVHRYHDKYFAPAYVMENNWKFDFLLSNLYSKMDYYEG